MNRCEYFKSSVPTEKDKTPSKAMEWCEHPHSEWPKGKLKWLLCEGDASSCMLGHLTTRELSKDDFK
ncbi:MAG: hypothetical protein JRJ65_16180 [Deltaproteobacteria bacterium]|nr:hypothetical protein [Deltaproteobacteria bacterium]